MRIGMVGLGRMGGNMTRRLLRGGHEVVGYSIETREIEELAAEGAVPAASLADLAGKLEAPRVVWCMVPAGDAIAATIDALRDLLAPGDTVVDGGNSHYRQSMERARALEDAGIGFVDAGTSGGIWGLEEGYCLMVGARDEAFAAIEPVLETLASEGGYARVGPPGAGHYVKMIHNGIEYALMQAYGEGFELLHSSDFDLDLAQISELWRRGSVVRSWLLDLAASALQRDPDLAGVAGYVEDSGEGRWTLESAIEQGVPAPAIAVSLFARFSSRQDESFSAKLLAALRREFGGHAVRSEDG